MKILGFSDLHRDIGAARAIVAASSDADVVVGAGDFATAGVGGLDTLEILRSCTVPVVLVHGNHDDPAALRGFCGGWSTGHYLHGRSIEIEGRTFFGLGGEIPARTAAPWNVAETEAAAASRLEFLPIGAILVTHTPPFGTADIQVDGGHEGSTAVRYAIRSRRPVLHLCGHIHAAWGTSGRDGETPVHNLGPGLTWLEV